MALLELMLIFVLQFEGISGREVFLYYRAGSEATLPCDHPFSLFSCKLTNWLYSKDASGSIVEVHYGNVWMGSARGARLSLSTDCSLVINNITAEDAGQYSCRHTEVSDQDTHVYLNILTVSPSPPDADPNNDGDVTLRCSLLRYPDLPPCRLNSLRWVDETGSILLGEADGYRFDGQTKCDSYLTVKHQSDHDRTYTCQFVQQGNVKIDAHYTPVFTGGTSNKASTNWSPLSYIMLTVRVAGLILMTVITVLVIRNRGCKKPPEENNVDDVFDYDDVTVSYENELGTYLAAPTLRVNS